MITTEPPDATASQTVPRGASKALPRFPSLAGSACTAGALPVALLLLAGRVWLAVSAALGVGISLGVCGLLFVFIERVVPLWIGGARDHAGAAPAQGAQIQFLLLLGAKLAFIALVGAAFLTLRPVSPVAVLVGFVLGQSAIVVSASRYRKPTSL